MRSKTRPLDADCLAVDRSCDAVAIAPVRHRRVRPYRIDSRTKKLSAVTVDVQRLLRDVAQLQQMRALLQEKTMSRVDSLVGSLSKTVRTYFQVFAHGYRPTAHLPDGQVVATNRFVASIMDDDVVGGGFRGVETLLENWKRFNAVFNNIELQLTQLTVVPLDETDDNDGRVLATATVTHTGYITLKTIEILFPHILSDAAFVMRLLGRPVSGDGRTTFVFDCASSRIVSCLIDIDMVGTFASVVRDPRELAVLFKMAQITPDGFIGDRDGIPADKAVAPDSATANRPTTREAMDMKTLLSSDDEALDT